MTHRENFNTENNVLKTSDIIERNKTTETDLSRQIAETQDELLRTQQMVTGENRNRMEHKIERLKEYLGQLKEARQKSLERNEYWENRESLKTEDILK